jgi:hypothetical protein
MCAYLLATPATMTHLREPRLMDSDLCVLELLPPAIASDEDYARRLGDGALWEPLARAALDLAGLDQPAQLRPGRPLGTYPTLLTDTGLVVKLGEGLTRVPTGLVPDERSVGPTAGRATLVRLRRGSDSYDHRPGACR